MIVNGKEVALNESITLNDFLIKAGYDVSRVVVERNLSIVPKINYNSVVLLDGDSLEIVHFVGGG